MADVGIAKVSINNQVVGATWTPPFRIEITEYVRAGSNDLKVEIANSWRNRLVGDRDRKPEQRQTRTNVTIKPGWTILESGLFGPVVIEKTNNDCNQSSISLD